MNTVSNDALRQLVLPSLRHLGIQLIDLQWLPGRASVLRLIIDRPAGITLDDCERVSNAVSAVLDAYDPIAGRYSLEVSSPGAERPLQEPSDWLNAVGYKVHVRYRADGADLVLEGRLVSASPERIQMQMRDKGKLRTAEISMANVISARITVDI